MRKRVMWFIKSTFFLFVFLLLETANSQTIETLWSQPYGGESTDVGKAVCETEDGKFIILGSTMSYGAGEYDIWLIKTDINGDTIWTKTIGGSDDDKGLSIDKADGNNFIITGYTKSYGAGSSDLWLIKVDANGDVIWEKTFGGSSRDVGNSVRKTSDGGYIVTGYTKSYGAGGMDLWLIKTDETGEPVWTKTYGQGDFESGNSVWETSDNHFIITGYKEVDVEIFPNTDVWLLKTDTSGDTLWTKTFGGDGEDSGESVQETNDGGYIIAGEKETIVSGAGNSDLYLLKTDSDGNLLWSKTLGGGGIDRGTYVQQTSDSGYVVCGYTVSYGAGMYDIWLIKTNSSGDTLFTKTFGGANDEYGYFVNETSDSGYVIVGKTNSYGAGDYDLWVIKTDKPKAAIPEFSPQAGMYNSPQTVAIICNTANADIYYTLDGSDPTKESAQYTNPIQIDTSLTLSARAFRSGLAPSEIQRGDFIINQDFNVIIETDSIWYDNDYNGFVSGALNAGGSTATFGNITAFKWIYQNEVVSTDSILQIILPSGSNKIFIELSGDMGNVKMDSISIPVYAAKLQTDGPIYASVSQLNNGLFFVSSFDDKVYCFDSTGVSQWSILTGGDIRSTNCVDNDDNIYVGSGDTRIYSFNKDGIPNWDKAMGGIINSTPSVSPEGKLYVGISTGRIMAMSKAGDVLWYYQTNDAIESSPSVSADNYIYFGSCDGKLYAMTPTGELDWAFETGDSILSSPALSADSSVIISSVDGYIYKINHNGELLWKFRTDGPVKSSPIIGYRGEIYVGSDDGYMYSISKDGILNWKYYCSNPVRSTASMGLDSLLYFGDNSGNLYVLDGTELQWHLQTGDKITASPLITDNGLIYVGSGDGAVYIIKSSVLSKRNSSLSEWPTFKGNYRRTGVSPDIISSLSSATKSIPESFNLAQNYPNPFNPITTIKFSIPKNCDIELAVYNILGEKTALLLKGYYAAGRYEYKFNATQLSSGLYFYVLTAENYKNVKKMLLVK